MSGRDRVRVYWNRRGRCWSVLGPDGRLRRHAKELVLVDVKFVVRRGGYEVFRRTGKRTVHAFAVGRSVRVGPPLFAGSTSIHYRPRDGCHFFCLPAGDEVQTALRAHFNRHGHVRAAYGDLNKELS